MRPEHREFWRDVTMASRETRLGERRAMPSYSMAKVKRMLEAPPKGKAGLAETLAGFGLSESEVRGALRGGEAMRGEPVAVRRPDPGVPRPQDWPGNPGGDGSICEPEFHLVGRVSEGADSDLRPSRGRGTKLGPSIRRLMIAVSPDGVDWTKTELVVADRADVPSMIYAEGRLWLFFVIFDGVALDGGDDPNNVVVLAHSNDLERWTYKRVEFRFAGSGIERAVWNQVPFDPSIVYDEARGEYRLYFSLSPRDDPSRKVSTFYAKADTPEGPWVVQGPSPVYEGKGRDGSATDVLDPNLLWVGDHYEFFAGGTGTAGLNHYARSEDGVTFAPVGDGLLAVESEYDGLPGYPSESATTAPVMMANGAVVEAEYVYFGFTVEPEPRIVSVRWTEVEWAAWRPGGSGPTPAPDASGPTGGYRPVSTSFWAWIQVPGYRLSLVYPEASEYESKRLQDPTVAALPGGYADDATCYVMVYVTEIPEGEGSWRG